MEKNVRSYGVPIFYPEWAEDSVKCYLTTLFEKLDACGIDFCVAERSLSDELSIYCHGKFSEEEEKEIFKTVADYYAENGFYITSKWEDAVYPTNELE